MAARLGTALVLASAPLFALNPNHNITQYLHRIWQVQPGLPQTSIYALTQTRDGYLWLGTQSGLVRFDGVRFSPVAGFQQATRGDIWVRAVEEDTTGNVWVTGNDSTLVRLSKEGAKVFDTKEGLPTDDFSCLIPGPNGEMWSCTANGLVRFRGDEFEVHESPGIFSSRPIVGCRTSADTIWIGGGSTLASWNGSQFARTSLKTVSGDLTIRALLCTDDELWVGTGKGLVRLKDGEEELFTTRRGLADNVILSLARGNGHVWAGTRNGFSRISNGTVESYGYHDGLSQNTVFAIREDREGSLWVATKNGLNQFLDGAATRYTRNEGLPSENMGPLLADRWGNLWAGTGDAGLAVFNGRRFARVAGLSSGRITALSESAEGALWVGTDVGLKQFADGQVQATYGVEQGLPSQQIRSLFRDHLGKLWVGTRKGPAVFENGHFVAPLLSPPGLARDLAAPISAIGETQDGIMLFAVEQGGVYARQNGGLRLLDVPLGGPSFPPFRDVNAIFTDSEGVVWMAANGAGLAIWRNGKLSRFLVRDGLFDNEIYGFVQDSQDRLWMACSNGFFGVTRAQVFKFADGKAPKIVTNPYSPLDGLRTVQGTAQVQPVGARTKDGRVWFSSSVWLLAFEPDLRSANAAPPVTIEEVTVNGTDMPTDEPLVLNPGKASVEFHYTALSFVSPPRMNFRYLLEGYDKNWTEAGTRREAFYNNLPPGKFRFRVSACGQVVPCAEASNPVVFEIPPHFYQRSWFIPLCIVLLALGVWMTHRVRVRRLREQFVLVLAERSRIARELHDTLIQGFSGITMQMQAFANRLRSSDDRHELTDIIRDAGICLQETRRSVAGLRAGTGSSSGLATAISDAARQLTQERDLRLKLNLDDGRQELPAEVKYNLLCIVQEAITNTIKHAGARTVEVSLSCPGKELRLAIRDDGRGILRNGANGADGGHYGMIGMKERASQMGGQLEITSAPGQGTSVSVCIPVTREAPVASPQETLETI